MRPLGVGRQRGESPVQRGKRVAPAPESLRPTPSSRPWHDPAHRRGRGGIASATHLYDSALATANSSQKAVMSPTARPIAI